MNQKTTLELTREEATILLLFLKIEGEDYDPDIYNFDALYPEEDDVDTAGVIAACLNKVAGALKASLKYRQASNVDSQRG